MRFLWRREVWQELSVEFSRSRPRKGTYTAVHVTPATPGRQQRARSDAAGGECGERVCRLSVVVRAQTEVYLHAMFTLGKKIDKKDKKMRDRCPRRWIIILFKSISTFEDRDERKKNSDVFSL